MIDVKKAYTYFQNKFRIKKSSKGWYGFDCPVCRANGYDNKMAVHFGTEYVKCWSASCLFGRGSVLDFIAYIENFDGTFEARMYLLEYETSLIDLDYDSTPRRSVEKKAIELPTGFHTILKGEGLIADRARQYLSGRGFDLKLLDREGFGFCMEEHKEFHKNYFGYIIVPFIIDNRLRYFLGRDFLNRGEQFRYKNPKYEVYGVEKADWIFNEDAIYMYKEVFLNEGWADAKTIGKQGISTQGWSISDKQRTKILRSNLERLVIVADTGAYQPAVKAAMHFVDKLETYVVNFDEPELAEFGKDVNEVGMERFMKAYQTTKPMTRKKAMEILIG